MRKRKLGMDKAGWESVTIQVPPGTKPYYKTSWYRQVSADTNNPLYFYILENPTATIKQVMKKFEFHTPRGVINFCHQHGLPLADLPPKKEKK